ncbi:MAG: ComEC/Rec2 family competence protein [Gemmatimonadales bacterium]
MRRMLASFWLTARLAAGLAASACAAPGGSAVPEQQDAAANPAAVEITFLDVGQGDAVLLRAPEGQTALVDAGSDAPLAALRALAVERVDLLVATHPHADHIGGMSDVLAAVPVRFFMDNAQPHTTATYRNLLATLERRTDVTYLAAEPRTVELGSVALEVLPLPPMSENLNNRSIAIVVRFGAFVAFLSGDSETEELEWLVGQDVVPDVTLLKAAHHGSDNGVTARFLERARPEVVVISVGANDYGHPGRNALAAYATYARTIHRTDRDGGVTVRGYEDGRFEIRTERP